MEEWRKHLAAVLREKRISMDLSQEKLAEKISRTAGSIGQMERGETLPSVEILYQLTKALGMDVADWFETEPSAEMKCIKELQSIMRCLQPKDQQILLGIAKLLYKMHDEEGG